MNRLDAIDLARAHALGHGQTGDHAYLPTTDAEAAEWLPHAWVVDAIVSAAEERERADAELVLVPSRPTQDMLYAMAECDGYQRGDRDHPMLTRWEDYWLAALARLKTPNAKLTGQGGAHGA